MSANHTQKALIYKSIEENNKATKEKLFHLFLVVIGVVLGWFLCYFFPLIEHHIELTGNLHQLR